MLCEVRLGRALIGADVGHHEMVWIRLCSVKIAALIVVSATIVSACGDRHPRPSEVIQDLPSGIEFTRDVDSAFGPGFSSMLQEAFDATDIAIGVVTLSDSNERCNSAVVAAFRNSRRVADLDQLRTLAAGLGAKNVDVFVPTTDIDGWLWPGDQRTCAEAVLAAEHDGLMIFGFGSAEAVERFVAHLPSVFE